MDGRINGQTDIVAFDGGNIFVTSQYRGLLNYVAEFVYPLVDRIIEHMTAPDCIYAHHWQVGDVLIWDERAALHRGMPWPFEQARTLASICVSASAADGLDSIRLPASQSM